MNSEATIPDIQTLIAPISLIITVISLYFTWSHLRKQELRREEVLNWANECIECMQSIYLISSINDPIFTKQKIDEIRLKAIFDTSTLIERGRLFFKNEVSDNFGTDKHAAYRGYRPRILDHLVVAHQVALSWPDKNKDQIMRRTAVAKDSLQEFVSLAQKEVGRQRATSEEALKGGDGIHLPMLMAAVNRNRLD